MDIVEKKLVKPRVHKTVVKQLAQRILNREWKPGTALPTEPELCEELNVSRSALREAIKVLGSKGLVTTRPRVGTVIQPNDDWNLLDEDLLRWSMDLAPSPQLVLSLIEARQVIEPAAARFAASRASAQDIEPLERAYADMARYKDAQDFAAFNQADIDFHKALLRASGNVVFHQLANIIGAALAYSFRLTIERAREPGASLPNHGEVIERIRARDTEGAYASMSRLLNIAIVDLGLSAGR
ncbi:FadR/GntR family transcriptional regulator [Pelagibacterium xiamenense]|uniref:FadR/GntR family transcriptional regulator n=1 Tax=Pelagibacterium xiamenense TaxID=2901140 RepID=UPI001E367340|nr:FadR/GntR family transcriptional regulator [Pelagibacterium xiamenense]MCD7059558.1 FadR family transcriptional regulator [Pelagibacterium xiamenense]